MVAEVIENILEGSAVEPAGPAVREVVLTRAALAAVQLAANDESRPILNTVWMRGDRAEACDGFMGASVQLPEPSGADIAIPRDEALKAFRKTTRKARGANVTVGEDHALTIVTEAKGSETLHTRAVEGHTAPAVGELLRTDAPKAVVSVAAKRMKQVFAFLESALDSGEKNAEPVVEMRVYGHASGIEFRGYTPDEQEVRAILMPMVIDVPLDKTGWVFDPVEGVHPREVGNLDLRRVLADEPKGVADHIALADSEDRDAILANVLAALGHEDQIEAVNALLLEAMMKEATDGE